jgi:predicted nucleotidyltransferase
MLQVHDCSEAIDLARLVLASDPRIRLALVFGSVARGRERGDSDLDVAIDMGQPLDAGTKMSLMAELAVRIGRPVDLIDLRTAGEPLLGQILLHGKRIVGESGPYAEVLKRHLFDEADFMPYYRRILGERRSAWLKS